MRALKFLVVVMGIVLVGGSVALVAAIIARYERRPAVAASLPPGSPVRTVLAHGGRIVAATLSGDRVLVRIARSDGAEELVLFDARDGKEVALIELPAGIAVPPPLGPQDRSGRDSGDH
jgi:hypothetical protein